MNRKVLICICINFCISSLLLAQQQESSAVGAISGRIIDSITGQAIDYATISLLKQEDNKVVNGTTTDEKGIFKLTNVTDGTYKMMVYFIGYKTRMKNNIVVGSANSNVTLGDIKLANTQTTLKEVTVSAEKSLIENKIDKMVYNVDKDLTSQGGVATDVLKKVPQVSVDVNGNVELQGNSNIRFLINGKPSTIFGTNLVDVLASIPASQIQSIEIITSPGAKYDAEGTGGIINIILKKNTAEGYNGNLSLTGGTRLENGALNLTAHKGKLGANAFFSGNAQLLSSTINSMNRSSSDPITLQNTSLLQNGSSDFSRNGYQSGAGFDYEITDKDNISGALNYNYFSNNTAGSLNRQSILQDGSGNTISHINDLVSTTNKFQSHTFDWSLNYKRKFKKKDQELNILYTASYGNNLVYYQQAQRNVSPDSIFNSSYGNNPGLDKETNISIDYTHPVSESFVFETGAKTVISQITSNSDVYLLNPVSDNYSFNPPQSSSLDYTRNVYSYYLSSTFKLFKVLDVKAGIRDEYTETNANFSNSNVNIAPYNSIVPSAILSRSLKRNQTIKLGYSHRIQRPDFRDLNPFINASDPKNVSTGNTTLRPEIADKIELTYSKIFEKGANINVVLFYRGQKDDIQPYTTYYPTYKIGDSTYANVAVSTRENIGREDNFGLNFFASIPITSKISLRTNLSAFERYIIIGDLRGQNISGFNYRINVNASYQVTATLSLEAFGNFNSPRTNIQGTMPSFTTYNFAFRKQLFNKKASLAITATNPFNKYVEQKTELVGQNFTLMNERQLPYRSFGINFTYTFGKLTFKKEKELEDPNLTNPPMGN